MDYKKESGARVQRLRLEKGWTLRELSTKTGDVLLPTRISNYETGLRLLGQQEAVILAKALETRPSYLMAVEDTQLPINRDEETLVKNWRRLPENERMKFYRQIEQLAIAYRDIPTMELAHIPTPRERISKAVQHKRVKR